MKDTYLDKMPDFSTFVFWFYRRPGNWVDVVDLTSGNRDPIAIIEIDKSENLIINAELADQLGSEAVGCIITDWVKFKDRPEYVVGSKFTFEDEIDAQVTYELLLYGSALITAYSRNHIDPDSMLPRIEKCIEWLRSTDFYTCPASTQYHDSKPQGLLYHTLKVAQKAQELASLPTFDQVTLESAIFAALAHDWCKIGLYQPYMRNVKDEVTGQWNQVMAYRYINDRAICLGHGTSSMYLAMRFFNISMDVALAIRWHMGRWNCVEGEFNELQQACRNYPLVHLIQFADQLAICNY